jgi:hypothetical protein
MSIFNKIKSSIMGVKKNNNSAPPTPAREISMSEREKEVYDEEQLTLQKLYEKWLCKDKWLLYKEGIPLLLGVNPDNNGAIDNDSVNKIEELWVHAQDCVQKKMLSVINIEQPATEWEVMPVDLYRWATVSRIAVPAEFSTLMGFVMQTVKFEQNNQANNQADGIQDTVYQTHREIVLGAATSLLVNATKQCKNDGGEIVVKQIVRLIADNKAEWFGEDKPLLEETAMTDLINQYVNLTKPVI